MFSLLELSKYIDQFIKFPRKAHSPIFNKIGIKQQTPYYTNYLSSDDDDYHQPDIFAPYTQENRTQRPLQSQPSQNMNIYPQNPAVMQNQQPMEIKKLK